MATSSPLHTLKMATTGCRFFRRFPPLIVMNFLLFTFLSVISSVCFAEDEIRIVHRPKSVSFVGSERLRLSHLPSVVSSIWGFSISSNDVTWSGVTAGNPFRRPEAIVVVEIDGFASLNDSSSLENEIRFPLEIDVESDWPFQLASDRVYVRFAESHPVLVRLSSDESMSSLQSQYPWLFSSLSIDANDFEKSSSPVLEKHSPLDPTRSPDSKFLLEAQLIREFSSVVENKSQILHDGVPDLFWLRLTNLQELISLYGLNSAQVRAAFDVLRSTLNDVKDRFVRAYDGNVLITHLAIDYESGNSIRLGRNLLAETTTTEKPPEPSNKYNIMKAYDENYPVIFTAILFTMLVFWLAVFAIALGIWHMEPGRDSIIYRMTSQRIKKDQ